MKKQEVEFLLSSLLTEYKEQHPYDDIPSITSINIPKVVKSFFLIVDTPAENLLGANAIYLDLVNQGTNSRYFAQALELVLSFSS